MINADERYLLQQAGFTERQINTQMQKFYNLFRVAPMPQMMKEWVGLTYEEKAIWKEPAIAAVLWTEVTLKEKNGY